MNKVVFYPLNKSLNTYISTIKYTLNYNDCNIVVTLGIYNKIKLTFLKIS